MSKSGGRFRKWAIVLIAVVFVYAIIGFFVVPPIVRSQMEKRGTEALSREVTVEKVTFNPFTFLLRVQNLQVAGQVEGGLASLALAEVNADPIGSLFRWQWHLSAVRLVEPTGRIRVAEDGTLNIADLLQSEEQAPEEPAEVEISTQDLPAVVADLIRIENWEMHIADLAMPVPFETTIGPMTFDVKGFTTRTDESSPYSFDGETGKGGTFAWSGTITVRPLGSKGNISFSGLSIPSYEPYAKQFLTADMRAGTVALSTEYEVELSEDLIMRLAGATMRIAEVALSSDPNVEPEVSMRQLEIEMPEADLIARTAQVSRVAMDGLDVRVERRADGSIDLLDWIRTPETEEGVEAPEDQADEQTDSGPAPSVQVAEIAISDAHVEFTDSTLPEPATNVVDLTSLTAKEAGTDLDKEVDLAMDLKVNEGGRVVLNGTVRPLPLAAAFDVVVENLALAPAQPYVQQFADVRLRGGQLQVNGRVEAEMPPDEKLKVDWTGDVVVDGVSVSGVEADEEMVALNRLGLGGTKFSLEPLSVEAAEIAIDQPKLNVVIDEDGMINLLTALRIDQTKEAAPEEGAGETLEDEAASEEKTSEMVAKASRQKLPFDAKIDLITISGGDFGLDDRSVKGGVVTRLNEFGGTIKGLSSESVARADVDLSAKLDGKAPLQIKGEINPLTEDQFSDIKVIFSDIRLTSFSPYAAKYLGQRIDKGTLNVDVSYRVSENVLNGANSIVVDQFYLGEKVQSDDALGLPVGMAIALLRDRAGVIELDVPVSGNLDDPSFGIGSVVMKTIGNIIVKAVSSPFSLLGNIVGGGGGEEQDLSYVDFDSGSAELTEAASGKLELLGKALFERPALRLDIIAPTSPETDRQGLVETRFREILQEQQAAADADAVDVHASEGAAMSKGELEGEETLIRATFVRMFPAEAAAMQQQVAAGEATAAESDVGTKSDGPGFRGRNRRPGFFQRLFGSGTSGDESIPAEEGAEAAPSAGESEGKATAADGGEPIAEPVPQLTVAEMRARIMDTIEVSEADYEALSTARAEAIREAILAGGEVEAERILVAESPSVPEEAETPTEGGRVYFGLE